MCAGNASSPASGRPVGSNTNLRAVYLPATAADWRQRLRVGGGLLIEARNLRG